ncbi:MAG TPA: hypothetical protein VNC61_12050 [Acidimicrobiales bacterium]|nr:hypothetical protein [Acidimicrobiales bacterium]
MKTQKNDGAQDATARGRSRKRALIGGVIGVHVLGTLLARRKGYNMGGDVIVRCRKGHLFTTIWVPGASFKAVRLGWLRWQRCPVGRHWSIVTPVRPADLTDDERLTAAQNRDIRIP